MFRGNICEHAAMAQLVEHILGKDEVPGPNPGSSSRQPRGYASGLWFLKEQFYQSSTQFCLGSGTAKVLSRREHLVLYSSNLGSSVRCHRGYASGIWF